MSVKKKTVFFTNLVPLRLSLGSMSNRYRHTRLIACLAIMAMMLPAMVPRGYMPRVDPHSGVFSIVLCPASWAISREAPDHDMAQHDRAGMDELCPFAVASTPVDVSPDYPGWLIVGLPLPVSSRSHTGHGQTVAGPPFPARGPPLPV